MDYSKLLVFNTSILQIIRYVGKPNISKNYFFKLMHSEGFTNIFYVIAISMPPAASGILYLTPIAI